MVGLGALLVERICIGVASMTGSSALSDGNVVRFLVGVSWICVAHDNGSYDADSMRLMSGRFNPGPTGDDRTISAAKVVTADELAAR